MKVSNIRRNNVEILDLIRFERFEIVGLILDFNKLGFPRGTQI